MEDMREPMDFYSDDFAAHGDEINIGFPYWEPTFYFRPELLEVIF